MRTNPHRRDYSKTLLGRAFLATNMSLDEVAKKSGVNINSTTAYLLASGEVYQIGIIAAIAEALDVDVRDAIFDYF